ncbi:hypothetical protein HanIR_Chr08g0347711 [Helianthus annuus]|nr:hypothetical protein HanIR_Chr08g0347711 [Helianthus annuus]
MNPSILLTQLSSHPTLLLTPFLNPNPNPNQTLTKSIIVNLRRNSNRNRYIYRYGGYKHSCRVSVIRCSSSPSETTS